MSNDDLSGDFLSESDDGFFGSEPDEGPDLFGDAPAPKDTSAESSVAAGAGEPVASPAFTTAAKAQTDGYIVLARKYRPQTFDDIVGQQAVQQGLRGAIATGQISHAYLFSGPRGTGKTSTARILAKALNCQEGGPRPDPCGKCASCRAITVGSSLDVIEIDAASNTGVDNIRELKSGVVLAPFSRYKVYIVDEVHMLSNQAFNALLKTLEEPPPQVIFVLATTELHKVPETIVSRCQTFMFRRFSMIELKSQLGHILDIEVKQRGLTVDPVEKEKILDLVARNAEGGMRDAQVTLDQVLVLSKGALDFESVRRFLGMADLEAMANFVTYLHGKAARELLELIDSLVAEGQDLELFVKGACEYLRDLLLVKCAGKDTHLINVSEERATELAEISGKLGSAFLIQAIDTLVKVVGEMKVSGQPRTILELAILKISLGGGGDGGPGDAIVSRLDQLEKRLNEAISQGIAVKPSAGSGAVRSEQLAPVAPVGVAPKAVEAPKPAPKMQEPVAEKPAVEPPAVAQQVAAPATIDRSTLSINPDIVVPTLIEHFRMENPVLVMSFEKAACGCEMKDRTMTIILDASQKMACQSLQRPQSAAIIVNATRKLFGEDLLVRVEERQGPPARVLEVDKPAPASAPKAPVASESINHGNLALQAEAEDSYDGDPRIYYPDEIREKTMLEVSTAEFQSLMQQDSNLKALVDKTMQVFGIDLKQLRFHRSTLA